MRYTDYYWIGRDNREGFPSFYLHAIILTVDGVLTF